MNIFKRNLLFEAEDINYNIQRTKLIQSLTTFFNNMKTTASILANNRVKKYESTSLDFGAVLMFGNDDGNRNIIDFTTDTEKIYNNESDNEDSVEMIADYITNAFDEYGSEGSITFYLVRDWTSICTSGMNSLSYKYDSIYDFMEQFWSSLESVIDSGNLDIYFEDDGEHGYVFANGTEDLIPMTIPDVIKSIDELNSFVIIYNEYLKKTLPLLLSRIRKA